MKSEDASDNDQQLHLQQQKPPEGGGGAAAAAASAAAPRAAASAAGEPGLSTPILLSALMLDPRTEMNAGATRMQCDRFAVVPSEDECLRYVGMETFRLQPSTYPSFLPPSARENIKIRAILQPTSIGQLDTQNGVIRLAPQIRGALTAAPDDDAAAAAAMAEEEEKSSRASAAAADGMEGCFKYPYMQAHPIAANQVFPISVALSARRGFESDLDARLRKDAASTPYRDTVWPRAIEFYRPLQLAGDSPLAHYTKRVLRNTMDPFFPVGLFGELNNGLSVVLLALSRAAVDAAAEAGVKRARRGEAAGAAGAAAAGRTETVSDKLRKMVANYIALVALQFWTLVHRRWLELDPKEMERLRDHMPPYLFYFHHATDFSQRLSKTDKKHRKKAEVKAEAKDAKNEPAAAAAAAAASAPDAGVDAVAAVDSPATLFQAALGPNEEGNFTPFVHAVLRYVQARMQALGASTDPAEAEIAAACRALELTDDLITKRCKYYETNHTNFFTCARLKLHAVRNFAELINANLRPPNEVTQLLDQMLCKFFPRSAKDDIKMLLPKPVNDSRIVGEHRYIMPYFWSHLTFTPDEPLVETASVLRLQQRSSPVKAGIHQACVLRKLAFVLNSDGIKALPDLFYHLDECRFDFQGSTRPIQQLTGAEFYERFVESRPGAVDLQLMRMQTIDRPIFLPPVVSHAALRYCFYMDEEVARLYVPMVSRDLGSLPTTHESDMSCMTKQQFAFLNALGAKQDRSAVPMLRDLSALTRQKIVGESESHVTSFHATIISQHLPALFQTAGLSRQLCKLVPENRENLLVFNSAKHRLTRTERRQLQLIAGVITADKPVEFDPAAMWGLLRKISSNEGQAVASYVFHARAAVQRVKTEPGFEAAAAAAAAEVSDDEQLADIFFDLQRALQRHRQIETDAFVKVWGPELALAPPKGKRYRGDPVLALPNPHWRAQQEFISAIDAEWNYCDKPTVPGAALATLVCEMFSVDFSAFDLVIYDKACEEYDCRKTISGDASDECIDHLLRFFHELMTPAYKTYDSVHHKSADREFDFLTIKKMHFSKAAPALAGLDFKSHEIRCNAPDGSDVLAIFRFFFNVQAPHKARKFETPYLDATVAFFMWYYYTQVLRPFIHCMPQLYPDTSLVKAKGRRNGKWIESLQASDATPLLSKTLYTLLGTLSKNQVFGELETAVRHNVVVSDRAESMLQAMQVVIRAHDALDLEEEQSTRLLQVQSDIVKLLARKGKSTGIRAGNLSSSAAPASLTPKSIQQNAAKVITQHLIHTKSIPGDTMRRLFDDLSLACDPDSDIPQLMFQSLLIVYHTLTASSPLTLIVLKNCVDSWKDHRSSFDLVLRQIKTLVSRSVIAQIQRAR